MPRVRALAQRLTEPVSPLGWVVALLAVVLVLVGRRLGWVELTVPGTAGVVVVLTAAVMAIGRSTYAVDLELSDQRVTVGQRAVGRIVVRNTSQRRLLPARIELPVGRGSADFPLPSLGPGAEHEDVFAVPTTRRSVVVVGPVRSVRGDPLGLVHRRVRWTDPVELYVHPELVVLEGTTAGVLRDLEGQATRVVSDADLSFHALREYEAGDDRRHIHWKTSARIGQLMVRQFEDTRRTHTAVALSLAEADYADADELELAVAVAASIGVQVLRDERDLTVLAGDRHLHTATPSRLLDDVAGLEPGPHVVGADGLATWVAREAADASVAILVTGSVPTWPDLRADVGHIPAGTRTLVVTCERGAEAEVATRGWLSMARVGVLGDLPRVLRRAVTG